MALRSVMPRVRVTRCKTLHLLLNSSHCHMKVLLSSRVDTPDLLLTLTHTQKTPPHTRTRTPPLSDTSRAISNQSWWLLYSSLNGGPDLRYAELFPSSPNFQATGGKRSMRKNGESDSARFYFSLCKPSAHLIVLPSLRGPGTAYAVIRGSGEENSLQRLLQILDEIA